MTNSSSQRAVMVVLAYLWPLALVPLLVEQKDADVRWHAKHGLVLFAAEIILFLLLWIVIALASMASIGLGCAVSMLLLAGWAVILTTHLAAVLKALNGRRLLLPWISDYASRF